MKKIYKSLAIFLSLLLLTIFACSCSNKDNKNMNLDNPASVNKDYDISFYNYKPEMQEAFQEIIEYYRDETGVKIKLVTSDTGNDNLSNIENLIKDSQCPTIYTIQGIDELNKLEKYGVVLNFNKASQENFKELIDKIPNDLRLSTDNYNNFGLPYNIEGYGYLVDRQLLASLLGLDSTDIIIEDLKQCSYQDFKSMVDCFDNFIKDGSTESFILNGDKYTLSPKNELTKNLNSVFSVAGAESWTYVKHMMNIALNAKFSTQGSAYKTSQTQIADATTLISKYAEALDLKTSHADVVRSEEFIADSNNYDNAVNNFSSGKSLFIKQGNWAYNKITSLNPSIAQRLTIIPVKLPLDDSDISVQGLTAAKLNSSIPIYVPMYYSINSNASEVESKLAQDFLVWLHNSDYAKDTLLKKFNSIPYDIGEYYQFDCQLNNDILKYKQSGDYLSAPYLGISSKAFDNFADILKSEYLTKQSWNEDDYKSISELFVSEWRECNK